ncbi:M48 family metalloprotease [Deltaproteobacteria bacterium]|nr:M48 family metalloprotease [Deltaproteobacteria bacterium]
MARHFLSHIGHLVILSLLLVNGLLSLNGCATNPATGRAEFMTVSEEREFNIGQQVDKQVREEMGIYLEIPELRAKVKEIVENIGRQSHRSDLIYRIEIVDTPDFNAFAVPGGFLYVHRGLLERMNSIDELASVIGHEIAHVAARHSASQISKSELLNIGLLIGSIATKGAIQDYGNLVDLGSILAFSKFSRDDERQADYFGIQYMTQAGYNPKASIDVMKEIQSLNDSEPGSLEIWFMTHPPTSERLVILNNELDILSSQDPSIIKKEIRRNEFIQLLDGMAVGEWNGIELISGDRYYNKEFLLSIPIPEGWQAQINNEDYTAIFFDEKKESFAYFNIQALRNREKTETYFNELSASLLKQGMKKSTKQSESGTFSHGAMEGFYQGSLSGLGHVNVQLFAFTENVSGYSLICLGKSESFEKLQPLFESMINGLDFISQQEASKVDPPRMRIHKVSAGETWDEITIRYFESSKEKKKLAEYNGLDIEDDLTTGNLLKIPPSLRFR